MTKNFIEVGGTYKSKNGMCWECIYVKGDRALLLLSGNCNMSAYVFKLDGTPLSRPGLKNYQLLPPKPKIDKNNTNLWRMASGKWCISSAHDIEDQYGNLYTHPDKVALFVPENINGETLAEAIGELQEEIGG